MVYFLGMKLGDHKKPLNSYKVTLSRHEYMYNLTKVF